MFLDALAMVVNLGMVTVDAAASWMQPPTLSLKQHLRRSSFHVSMFPLDVVLMNESDCDLVVVMEPESEPPRPN